MTNNPKKAPEIAKERSRNNIQNKIDILHEWSSNGLLWQTKSNGEFIRDKNGDKIIEWIPKNIMQFCKWNGTQNSEGTQAFLPVIKSLSRDTLYKGYNDDLRNQYEQMIPALNALEDKMLAEASNASIIQRLEKDIKYWKSLADAEATNVLSTLKRLDEIDKKYRKAIRARANNEAELQKKIDELTIENAALNKLVSKVKGLKVVDNEE